MKLKDEELENEYAKDRVFRKPLKESVKVMNGPRRKKNSNKE